MQPNLGLTALVIKLVQALKTVSEHAYLHTSAGCQALFKLKDVQIPITSQHITEMAKAAFIQHLVT